MVDIDVFIKRFNNLPDYLRSKSGDMLMKHEKEIVAMNNAQLMEGKNTRGEIMQRGYSPAYAKRRNKAGLQTSFVDLRFTGKYQDSRKGVKVKEGMNIKSSADYEKYLRGNFPNHVGLTTENADKISELLEQVVAKEIKKYLLR